MPSSSKKQHNFMAAVAHSPSFAKKVGVPQSVGKDFTAADKGKKFMNPRARKSGGLTRYASGGSTSASDWLKKRNVKKGPNPLDNPKYREKGLEDLSPYFVPGVGGGATKAVGFASKLGKASKLGSLARSGLSKVGSALKGGAERKIVGGVSGKIEKGFKHIGKESAKEVGTEHGLEHGVVEPIKHSMHSSTSKKPTAINLSRSSQVKRYAAGGPTPPKKTPPKKKSDPSANETQLPDFIAKEAIRMKQQAKKTKRYKEGGETSSEPKKYGFFGSLLTGNISKYNEQERAKRQKKSVFSGIKAAPQEEKKSSKPIDLDLSGGVETAADVARKHRKADKQQRQLRRSMKQEEQQRSGQKQEQSSSPSSSGTFKSAFAAARKGGASTFTWNGKKYTTELKGGSTKPATSTSSAPAKKDDSKPASSSSSSRSVLLPFGNNTGVDKNKFAEGIATRVASKKSGWQPFSGQKDSNQERLNAEAKARAVARQKTKDEAKAAEKKKKADAAANFKPSANKTYNYCGGGSVKRYASGGMVSSRADGIASRGRTKCKIV